VAYTTEIHFSYFWKPKIKVPDDLFSCDCSFPALKTAGYLLYLHMTFVQGAWKDKDLHLPIRTIIPS
jgi:hypothetical protein